MPSSTPPDATTAPPKLSPRLAVTQLGLSFALLVACLLGAEATLRSDAAYELLPIARAYYSYDVTRRLRYLKRLRERGPIDVLFLGSSVVRANIDPERFDATLEQQGKHVLSFNAGLSSMFAPAAKLYLEHVWLDAAEPRYVLHGVREAELAIGPRESRHLRKGPVESKWIENTPWSLLQASVTQHVQLVQYRGTLRKVIQRWRDDEPWHIRERGELTTGDRGFRAERAPLKAKRKAKSKRLWKYHGPIEEDRYQHALRALDAMRKLCAQAGAKYVLVHMPEHPERFDLADGPAVWNDYQQRIRAWAKRHDVPFLDVTGGDLRAYANDAYYSDFHHMSPKGAKRFSTQLAEHFAGLLAREQ